MCRGVDKLGMLFGGGICSRVTEVLSRQAVSDYFRTREGVCARVSQHTDFFIGNILLLKFFFCG